VIYSQTSEAPKSGPYSHTEAPDMSGAGGEAKPSGSGPRGKVVDADYTESD
jgi:molecular chaperone DnaK